MNLIFWLLVLLVKCVIKFTVNSILAYYQKCYRYQSIQFVMASFEIEGLALNVHNEHMLNKETEILTKTIPC